MVEQRTENPRVGGSIPPLGTSYFIENITQIAFIDFLCQGAHLGNMNAVTFDTHAFVKRLTAAGMPEPQAEVLAEEQSRLIDTELATKRDIKELELATRRDIKELETVTRRDIKELETANKRNLKELEYRLTVRLGSIATAVGGAVVALVKLL